MTNLHKTVQRYLHIFIYSYIVIADQVPVHSAGYNENRTYGINIVIAKNGPIAIKMIHDVVFVDNYFKFTLTYLTYFTQILVYLGISLKSL